MAKAQTTGPRKLTETKSWVKSFPPFKFIISNIFNIVIEKQYITTTTNDNTDSKYIHIWKILSIIEDYWIID